MSMTPAPKPHVHPPPVSYSTPSPLSRTVSESALSISAHSHSSTSSIPDTPSPANLAGIQPPAPFPGDLPLAYLRKEPVPSEDAADENDDRSRQRHGAVSCNPWDYQLVESSEQSKNGEEFKGKARRRFTKKELEALEVLWSITKSPTKYERQRLGSWLGVKTKHITVWFQNRRQEEKRHSREGAATPQPSRANRGTYDPVTGKWRPVPLSCISGLQPPPAEKVAIIKSISLGDITRESYFAEHPPADSSSSSSQHPISAVPRRPLLRTGSGSLDEVLQAREVGFGAKKQVFRREGYQLPDEEEDRRKDLVAMMQSDAPSSDPVEQQEDDDEEEEDNGPTIDDGSPRQRKRAQPVTALGRGRPPVPLASEELQLGRATSLNLLAASSRAKHLVHNDSLRSVSGPSSSLDQQTRGVSKHSLAPVPTHGDNKRARADIASSSTGGSGGSQIRSLRSRDSFSRAQSNVLPQLQQTPTPGFTRSASFSSTSTGPVITPDNSSIRRLAMEEISEVNVKTENGQQEADEDVLSAASSLLAMLGGA
ncbi:hypothetical protein EHS25_002535 [Saitozyma podzolica]|uniref:Homeobox domain-containing protein n=1 Tax=Saitozyma podzolica TaxID=1890683 RepID=A0A427YCT5_9TREE|nr:hypothetical protein EHS25_002535 [Saitozyma podzolica]